jgi:hypothetical protein
VTNLLSIGAAMGVIVVVFQWRWLGGVLGVQKVPIRPAGARAPRRPRAARPEHMVAPARARRAATPHQHRGLHRPHGPRTRAGPASLGEGIDRAPTPAAA